MSEASRREFRLDAFLETELVPRAQAAGQGDRWSPERPWASAYEEFKGWVMVGADLGWFPARERSARRVAEIDASEAPPEEQREPGRYFDPPWWDWTAEKNAPGDRSFLEILREPRALLSDEFLGLIEDAREGFPVEATPVAAAPFLERPDEVTDEEMERLSRLLAPIAVSEDLASVAGSPAGYTRRPFRTQRARGGDWMEWRVTGNLVRYINSGSAPGVWMGLQQRPAWRRFLSPYLSRDIATIHAELTRQQRAEEMRRKLDRTGELFPEWRREAADPEEFDDQIYGVGEALLQGARLAEDLWDALPGAPMLD